MRELFEYGDIDVDPSGDTVSANKTDVSSSNVSKFEKPDAAATASTTGPINFWNGLSTANKIAVAGIPAALVGVPIAIGGAYLYSKSRQKNQNRPVA